MKQLTRSKIAYDLSISPHRLPITYGESPITFVFSSNLYLTKFTEKQEENRNSISESLSKRFGFEIRNNLLADIKLYKTIEKRGFLLLKDNGEVCQNQNLKLDGEKLIVES